MLLNMENMVKSTLKLLSIAAFAVGVSCTGLFAQEPDNSKMNKQEKVTADKQKNNSGDIEVTKNIRQSIMEDKSLSTYAHNVKIITRDGAVTLKGPVRSEEEKKAIEDAAAKVAGADKVTSQLTVKPSTKKS